MNKYIQLFEEHQVEGSVENKKYAWSDVRNTMQQKLPFAIVDFSSEEGYIKCKDSDLVDKNYMEQEYHFVEDEQNRTLKSVFIFGHDGDPVDVANKYQNQFGAHRVIIGEKGKDFPTVFDGGESGEFGNDLLVAMDPAELGSDDYYSTDSTLYQFIST